ncbi:MAG: transposase [Planctomycetia bacterium]|nr:transposase [Planctomycetia bacterium]
MISDLFKKKFLDYLKEAYRKGEMKFVGKVEYLRAGQEFQAFLNTLYHRKWITYCKRPFGGPEQVLEYLGRYTHRVAISNERIVKMDDGTVTFRYRDYRDGNQVKQMSLEAFEFIRRFLLHILPDNFVKIRYYGLFNNRNRKAKIRLCKEVLGAYTGDEQELTAPESWEELFARLTGIDPRICPCCGKGRMVRMETLLPLIHAPPGKG